MLTRQTSVVLSAVGSVNHPANFATTGERPEVERQNARRGLDKFFGRTVILLERHRISVLRRAPSDHALVAIAS